MLNKWVLAAICVVMGGLQAWDSGVLGAGTAVQGLVALAIVLPVSALLASTSYGIHALSVAAAFGILTAARLLSPIPLPTLHMVAFIPAIVIFFSKVVRQGGIATHAGRP